MLFPWWIKYPNVNNEIQNLDWLMYTVKHLSKEVKEFINLNTIKYADPILWDITHQYEANTVVVDGQTGNAYISTKAVPSGVHLNRTEYWTQIYNYADALSDLRMQIAYDEGNTTTASKAFAIGDLVFVNELLYRVISPMIPGDSFIVDSNVVKTTVEEEISDILNRIQPVIDEIVGYIGDLDDLDTTTKTNLVLAINEVVGNLGDLTNLNTTDKSNLVAAINEVLVDIANINDDYVPCIDVTKYGLVADGVTDNYAAFNTLYAEHKELYFPEGTYYFSQPITLDRRATVLKGSGYNTFLVFNGDGILISNFYAEVSNFTMRTKGQGSYGIKLLSSYAKIHDLWMYDGAGNWFNNFILGTVGQGVWFSFIENIIINDSSNSTNNGTVMELTSTVNNVFSNIIATQKNIGLKFNPDNTVGYSTDGCQLNDLNFTQMNQAFIVDGCSAIYLSHTIFDQIKTKCLEIVNGNNITFDECYLSAGNSSPATFKIADIIDSTNITINSTKMSGAGTSTYGVVISNSSAVSITDSRIGHTTNGITFSDANSTNCYIYNIEFNDLVNRKLYVQGYSNIYALLKGIGTVVIADGLQSASIFNQGTITIADLGTDYYYDCDIPLPTGMAKPIIVNVINFNSDISVNYSYLYNTSPSGYARIRLRRHDAAVFNHQSVNIAYAYPIA